MIAKGKQKIITLSLQMERLGGQLFEFSRNRVYNYDQIGFSIFGEKPERGNTKTAAEDGWHEE